MKGLAGLFPGRKTSNQNALHCFFVVVKLIMCPKVTDALAFEFQANRITHRLTGSMLNGNHNCMAWA